MEKALKKDITVERMVKAEGRRKALPAWASLSAYPHGALPVIDVDAEGAYLSWLAELKVKELDQYWLEVAYQCFKMELQVAMEGFVFEIHVHDKERRFAQKKFPRGRGPERASTGLEARAHFLRLRGHVPA